MTARRAAAADADARTAEEHHAAMLDHDPLQDDGEAQDIQQQEADEDDEEEEDEDAVVEYDDGLDIYESGSVSGSTETLTWISWFCALPGHEYFTEVTEDFIEDDFNLTGLNALVPFYKEALEMILDVEPQEESLKIPDVSIVESSAELLYGLIHQRYILTRQGLQQMVEKYEAGHFGYCPRVYCHSHPVLPCGRSDLPGLDTVKLFCPNCIDNYAPPSSRFHGVDGAFFGTTFPHLLFQTYRELAPSPIAPRGTNAQSLNATQARPVGGDSSAAADSGEAGGDSGAEAVAKASEEAAERAKLMARMTLKPEQLGRKVANARIYTPRIYGFRVSEHAKSGPRMRWMRMRPESLEELELGAAPTSANVAEPAAGQSEAPQ